MLRLFLVPCVLWRGVTGGCGGVKRGRDVARSSQLKILLLYPEFSEKLHSMGFANLSTREHVVIFF